MYDDLLSPEHLPDIDFARNSLCLRFRISPLQVALMEALVPGPAALLTLSHKMPMSVLRSQGPDRRKALSRSAKKLADKRLITLEYAPHPFDLTAPFRCRSRYTLSGPGFEWVRLWEGMQQPVLWATLAPDAGDIARAVLMTANRPPEHRTLRQIAGLGRVVNMRGEIIA
jgi:hypothetical protein